MITEENYIMWLTRQDSISAKKMMSLLEYFGSAEEIFKCDAGMLEGTKLLSDLQMTRILASRNENTINGYIQELADKGIRFISVNNEEYPYLLKQIYDPPIGLYMLGAFPDDSLPKVSIIGSRKCSQYGITATYKISKDLAKNGVVIVSGMARGIDSMAHKAALDAGGLTIAVLGSGVDVCYPPENKGLMREIAKNGCVISEFPPSTEPYKAHFPIRNRIISGLSHAVAVVEASKQSGTGITVNQALDQGRDVFAIPGNITSKMSQATNQMIKEGAYPLTEASDILFRLGFNDEEEDRRSEDKKILSLAPEEKLVYDCISLEPVSTDELVAKTNSRTQTIQYILTMLELGGYIQRIPGQKYIRKL